MRFAPGLVLILALILAPGTLAQAPRAYGSAIRFGHIDTRDGLSSTDITRALVQDTLGFVWIGTFDGLNRYDGTDIAVFRPTPFDSLTLRDTGIIDAALTPDGTLWVATLDGGLHRYDPRYERFAYVPGSGDDTDYLSVGPSGALWVATRLDGFFRLDPATGEVRAHRLFPRAPDQLDNGTRAVLEARDGAVWVSSNYAGIYRREAGGSAFEPVPLAGTSELPSEPPFTYALTQRDDGSVWAASSFGLLRFDEPSQTFRLVPQWEAGHPALALLEDPSGALWIGAYDGLYRLTESPGGLDLLDAYHHASDDDASLHRGSVTGLLLDQAGLIWAGGSRGLSTFSWYAPVVEHVATPARLPEDNLWALGASRSGALWVGDRSGLARIEAGGSLATSPLPPQAARQLQGRQVASVYEDRAGVLWIGVSDEGLFTFDPSTGALDRRLTRTTSHLGGGLFAEVPWNLYEDARGRIWVLSGPGIGCLTRYDPATGETARYCHDPDDPAALSDDMAHDLAERPDGTLWIGTWGNGLDHLDPERGLLANLRHDPSDPNTPSSDFICTLRPGPDGAIWLGYFGFGLSRFDPDAGTFTHLHTGNSALPNDVVYAMEWDAHGDLWMSTNAGIIRYRPSDGSVLTLGAGDGVQTGGFLEGASAVLTSGPTAGVIAFGGRDGVSLVHPSRIRPAETPRVVLTGIQAGGRALAPGRDSLLTVAPPLARSLHLPPHLRDVELRFAALQFGGEQAPRYRYRLEGRNEAWREASHSPSAAFTNLPPGTYTFRAQTVDAVGAWTEGATLALTVAPFFYETRWFLGLCLLVLSALVGAAFHVHARQARRREVALEQTVQTRTAELRAEKRKTEAQSERLVEIDRAKSRFFTNVSHEFRTPLTLTISPLEDLERDPDLPASARAYVDLALRNSRRLLRLIGQLLDVAKLDVGALQLHAEPVDLATFARECAAPFVPFAERRRVRFEIETPPTPVWAEVDAEKLEQVVMNLLSNAFKFTPEGRAIRMDLAVAPASGAPEASPVAVLTIRDTGPGIPPDHLPHLFDRFYQSEGTASDVQAGSGIGLSLARDLAELHGGTLVAESTLGFGATFTLTLPARPDAAAGAAPTAAAPPSPRSATLYHGGQQNGRAEASAEREDGAEHDEAAPRPTVLVVDDHADIRAYLRSHLAAQYHVEEAADGEQALALIRNAPPDLIVSDVMMPRLDGFALVRALKSDPATDFVPLLLLTAKATAEEKLEGLGVGADDYLTKPFDARELVARLANLLAAQHRLKQHLAARPPSAPLCREVPGEPGLNEEDTAFLRRAEASVAQHLGDEAYSVKALAGDLGQSRSSVHRRMRALLGCTPSAYIRRARLQRAAELLAAREGSVGEVAYAVGFKNLSHFSSAFKDEFGHTPTGFLARTPLPE